MLFIYRFHALNFMLLFDILVTLYKGCNAIQKFSTMMSTSFWSSVLFHAKGSIKFGAFSSATQRYVAAWTSADRYGTAQLQGNIWMCLKLMQDASGTWQDVSGMCTRCIRASAKPHDKAAARRMWVPCPFFARRGCVRNACKTRLKHVKDASGTRANVTLELSRNWLFQSFIYYPLFQQHCKLDSTLTVLTAWQLFSWTIDLNCFRKITC